MFSRWGATQDLDVCGCSTVTLEGVSDMLYARQEAAEHDENDQVCANVGVVVGVAVSTPVYPVFK